MLAGRRGGCPAMASKLRSVLEMQRRRREENQAEIERVKAAREQREQDERGRENRPAARTALPQTDGLPSRPPTRLADTRSGRRTASSPARARR